METKNRMYQLYELRDEFKKALTNSKLVEENEKKLVGIILKSPEADQFQDFIKGITSNWEEYVRQRVVINTKLEKINYLISLHEKKDEQSKFSDNIISLVLEILGSDVPEKPTKKSK